MISLFMLIVTLAPLRHDYGQFQAFPSTRLLSEHVRVTVARLKSS